MAREFFKYFSKISTTENYYSNESRIFTVEEYQDYFYAIPGEYVVLTGTKQLFALIRKVAIANQDPPKKRQEEIKKALQNYHKSKQNDQTECKYFLLSTDQIKRLVEEYARVEKNGREVEEAIVE